MKIVFDFNQNEIKKAPILPGCYLFKNSQREIIYIGKAVNLKNRLLSYLSKGVIGKTKSLVENIKKVNVIVTESELESLILESLLIKKYLPKYNILLKDDKSYLYIKITDEKYPRVISSRKTDISVKSKFIFGPFPSTYQAKYLLRIIRKIYPFCLHKIGKRACLDHQIGLCDPCPSVIDVIVSDKEKKLERAKYLKNVSGVVKILSGNLKKVRADIVSNIEYFSKNEWYREALKERQKLEAYDYITQKKSRIEVFLENPNYLSDIKKVQLKYLSLLIDPKKYFKQIECYDIAHISGSYTTASVVRFTDGIEDKKYYRHLKIYGNPKANDIVAMEEVAKRRKKHFKDWGKPDLMLIDGGIAQINIFKHTIGDKNIEIIGYEKRSDNLVYTEDGTNYKHFRLRNHGSEFLIRHLISEAHRFARRYHHTLIRKSIKAGFV